MKKNVLIRSITVAACMIGAFFMTTAADAKGYGKIVGKFVFKGDIPDAAILVAKGDTAAKDAKVCAVDGVNSQALVIDEKTKGVKNIFIYIKKMKAKDIHPKLAKSEKEIIDYDQVGCEFLPHVLVVRTDQKVRVLSDDACAHNFHSVPSRQDGVNFLVQPKDRKGTEVSMEKSEGLPTTIKCDIHPWMKGYWMVLDHPYCAVTKADGTFEIDLVPAGKVDVRVWHEMKGYVNAGKKTGFKAKVKDGKTFDLGTIELTADDLDVK